MCVQLTAGCRVLWLHCISHTVHKIRFTTRWSEPAAYFIVSSFGADNFADACAARDGAHRLRGALCCALVATATIAALSLGCSLPA
jgi:hypothetical protein